MEQGTLKGTHRVGDGLNLAEGVASREAEMRAQAPVYPDPIQPDIIVSIDIESLALGPRPIITEVAMLGYDLREGLVLDARHIHNYPVEPQQRIIPAREIHLSTLIARAAWTHTKGIDFAQQLQLSSATEFEDLASLCRNFITVFNLITDSGRANYEVVCARPQFDIVAIETLLAEVGLEKPWAYDSIIDVRTMLKRAGINHKNVQLPSGCIPHTGYGDSRWQIEQYLAALRGTVA
jgi:hypothetical protein